MKILWKLTRDINPKYNNFIECIIQNEYEVVNNLFKCRNFYNYHEYLKCECIGSSERTFYRVYSNDPYFYDPITFCILSGYTNSLKALICNLNDDADDTDDSKIDEWYTRKHNDAKLYSKTTFQYWIYYACLMVNLSALDIIVKSPYFRPNYLDDFLFYNNELETIYSYGHGYALYEFMKNKIHILMKYGNSGSNIQNIFSRIKQLPLQEAIVNLDFDYAIFLINQGANLKELSKENNIENFQKYYNNFEPLIKKN